MAAAAVGRPPTTDSFGSVTHTNPTQAFQTQEQQKQTAYPTALKHDVNTILNFHLDNEDGSPPAPVYVNKPESYVRPLDAHKVTIKDVRGEEDKYTLDTNGFEFRRHTSVEKDFVDDEQIKAQYYPETEQLLKDATGASKVFIFDHTIRRDPAMSDEESALRGPKLRGPAMRAHIDQSYDAALSRVPHHLPDEAERLLKGRVQIINVWRPIRQVLRDPLAVAEASSVVEEDLVVQPLIYPNRAGETFNVRYNEGQKWHYKSGLEPEEVLLIKCFDSKTDGRARRVPHSAFVDPAGDDAPTRQSIEVRALVFHEDDQE